jgi:hypothetical protein
VKAWENLLNSLLEEELNLDLEFYMLTPQGDPSPTKPSSLTNIPIFQVGFGDLAVTGDRSCGIEVVRRFGALLKRKRDRNKQKT